jgi:peptidoglycan-associated lipoprotein
MKRFRNTALILAAGSVVVLAGCSHIGTDEFNSTVADLRAEMSDHDQRIVQNEQGITQLDARLADLEQELETMETEFQTRIERMEDGLRFATPIHFEFDSYAIRAVDRPLLDRFAHVVHKYYPNSTVTVEGFADPAGSEAYNRELSQKRAEAVANFLAADGGLDDVSAVGYGEERQVRPGEYGPGDGGLENRRVTFVIEYAGSPDSEMHASTR